MEQFNFGGNNSSNNKQSKNKKVWTIVGIIAGVLLGIMIISAILGTNSGSSGTSNDSNDKIYNDSSNGSNVGSYKLEVTQTTLHVEYSDFLGYTANIRGTAKNISKRNYSYASVEFSVDDVDGNNLGTALANINNLGKGETWRFEATLLAIPKSKPISFKLVDITAW